MEKTIKKAVSGIMAGVLLVTSNVLPAGAVASVLNGKKVEITATDEKPLVIYEGAHIDANELFSLTNDETLTLSQVEEKYREVTYTDSTTGEKIQGYVLESELNQYLSTFQKEVTVTPSASQPLELMINGSSIGDNLVKLTSQTKLTVLSSEGHTTKVNYTNPSNGKTVEALIETGALKNAITEEVETSTITVSIPEGESLSFWNEASSDAALTFELFKDSTLTLGEEVQYVRVQYNDIVEVETEEKEVIENEATETETIETVNENEAPVMKTVALETAVEVAIEEVTVEEVVAEEEIATEEETTVKEEVATEEETTIEEEVVVDEETTKVEESIVEYDGYIIYGDFINAVTDEVAAELERGNHPLVRNTTGIIPNPTVLDISHWQLPTDMDYDRIASQIELVIIRVQSGETIDNHYQTHIAEFQKRGIPVHVYAYFRGTDVADARSEARAFYEKANPFNVDMYWVDVEEQSAPNMKEAVSAFTDELRSLVDENIKIGAYVAHHMYTQFNLDLSIFDGIWIPRYGANDGKYSGINPDFPTDLHQYTDKGRLNGFSYDLDLNRVTGTHGRDINYFTTRAESTTPEQPTPEQPKPEEPKPEQPKPETTRQGQTTARLNMRKGAGTNHGIIRTLPLGQNITILSENNGWMKIRVGNEEGYVSSEYVKITNGGESTTPAPTPTTRQGQTTARLNMRKGAGTNHGIIRTLSLGQNITILSESNGWMKVKVGNEEGYVSSEYVKVTNGGGSTTPAQTQQGKTTARLNFRVGAGTNQRIIRTLPLGQTVNILSESNGWMKVRVGNEEGYVSSEFIKKH